MLARRTRLVVTTAVLVLTLQPVTGMAQIEELEQAEQRVAELDAQLDVATATFEQTRAQVEAKEDELEAIELQNVELVAEVAALDDSLNVRARLAFMRGGDTAFASLLSADSPQDAVNRSAMLNRATARDVTRLEDATALRLRLTQTAALAEDARDELAVLTARLDAVRLALNSQLDQAQSRAQTVAARAARQRRINNGRMNGIYACIFDQGVYRFRDTWGAPRSGGRSHKGVDVFAPYFVNVYAFTNGVVSRTTQSGLGGINLYLLGDDGTEYFYAHLNGYAPGIGVGSRVRAGDLVASNGDSGNARGTPHVHWEAHPGGAGPVSPYPFMAAACL